MNDARTMCKVRFDVFLAHNSRNQRQVEALAVNLHHAGVNPWLDSEQIVAGMPFAEEISRGILDSRSVAVCIGHRLGRWQAVELRAAINLAVERDMPVMPVLLPGVQAIPEALLFLRAFSLVKFSRNVHEPEGIAAMVRAVRRCQS
jgi:hypothetical protein